MHFAISLPPWTGLLLVTAALLLAWAAYAQPLAPLSLLRRTTLTVLRAFALLLIVAAVLRPIRVMPPDDPQGDVVPILVDVSRSMALADAGGRPRIDVARDVVERQLGPALAQRFRPEIWTFGTSLAPLTGDAYAATAPRTDLSGSLRAIRERYRDRQIPGVIVISDGGDTGVRDAAAAVDATSPPVFTIGVGGIAGGSDFEVADVSAGEGRLADSSIDLSVTAVSHGTAKPFDLRVLENGRPIDLRQLTPAHADAAVRTVFTVAPPRGAATLYTVEIPAGDGEAVVANNRRTVLVEPPGRRRRVLVIEGAPGFEHSFVKRALTADDGIEVDSIVRKGRDAQGQPTYFVHAAAERGPRLSSGFPDDRDGLFHYDALILANVENDMLTAAQLELARAFVGERGGGLLVLGARSFGARGLVGSPIEDVLPTGLADRGNGVLRASADTTERGISVTSDGEVHPVMRIGRSADETARLWSGVPALADTAALGGLRPGARALALVRTPDGPRPLVAVQRYGQGRSMVFAGEASWHWRMQLPAADRTFELFWRQTARWLSAGSPDPVAIADPGLLAPGESAAITVDVRDASYQPVTAAQIDARVVLPDGTERALRPGLAEARSGRYAATFDFERPGIYRILAGARSGTTMLGTAERWVLVGGADLEMADPRLNEEVLRRISRATGGEYQRAADAGRLPAVLKGEQPPAAPPRVEELWHTWWLFAAIVGLLATEWLLRRQWGLR